LYGELFWVLQNDTKYIATLARLVNLGQIDNLLQTVMFTLYGNQYDEMEEHLLLSMFRVRSPPPPNTSSRPTQI
jgi:Ras GTPase-activating-like protein IQGAP2/3